MTHYIAVISILTGLVLAVQNPDYADVTLAAFFGTVIVWMVWELYHADPENLN